jgi:hypothetical protein
MLWMPFTQSSSLPSNVSILFSSQTVPSLVKGCRNLQTFYVKAQMLNILGFLEMWPLLKLFLSCFSETAAVHSTMTNRHSYTAIKFTYKTAHIVRASEIQGLHFVLSTRCYQSKLQSFWCSPSPIYHFIQEFLHFYLFVTSSWYGSDRDKCPQRLIFMFTITFPSGRVA